MKRVAALAALALAACSDAASDDTGASVRFPENYAQSYEEVRGCRKSSDHELHFIRVLTDPEASAAYATRTSEFQEGAVVLKEEYEADDAACSGEIIEWTVMIKNRDAAARLGWDWQRVRHDRSVAETNASRCYRCHASCSGGADGGFDSTCTEP